MDVQSVLIGALLLNDQLAPYSLPELSIEHFRPELQPAFAAVQGFWIKNGQLDILQIVARYPNQKQPLMDCVGACESECIRLTRDPRGRVDTDHHGGCRKGPLPEPCL